LTGLFTLHVAVSKQLDSDTSRLQDATTVELAMEQFYEIVICQLKIIRVVRQLKHNYQLNSIPSNNCSLIKYWNFCFTEFKYVRIFIHD